MGRKACVFCDRNDEDENVYGKLLTKAGLTAHYFCMVRYNDVLCWLWKKCAGKHCMKLNLYWYKFNFLFGV